MLHDFLYYIPKHRIYSYGRICGRFVPVKMQAQTGFWEFFVEFLWNLRELLGNFLGIHDPDDDPGKKKKSHKVRFYGLYGLQKSRYN